MKAGRANFGNRDPDADAATDARAEADIEAGRIVDHDEVAKWLATWGTPEEAPPPAEWLA